jgi:putative DNA methylase
MRKKMIEVAIPLDAINRESAREKSIRHGHPSTLHLWWARRPLAACRAVIFTSLVDDPDSDPANRNTDGTINEEKASARRKELFQLVEDLVKWENTRNLSLLNKAKAEIAATFVSAKVHDAKEWIRTTTVCGASADSFLLRTAPVSSVDALLAEYLPPLLDPFAGGGSIPLEAQRLGLRAFASDLNPVPVLINKALLEIPVRFAQSPPVNPEARTTRAATGKRPTKQASFSERPWTDAAGITEDVRYYGKWMRDKAQERIGELYPRVRITKEMARDRRDLEPYVGEEVKVIAWIWARTVASPQPAVGHVHVPLARSFFLSTKKGREVYARPAVAEDRTSFSFQINHGAPPEDWDPKRGTVNRNGATCILSGDPIAFDHIRAEGKAGRLGSRLIAIACEGARGRLYLAPTDEHERAAVVPMPSDVPDTSIPAQALSFRVQLYGMDKHSKLFTPRQLAALTTFSDLVLEARDQVLADLRQCGESSDSASSVAYADAVATYLAMLVSRYANYCSTLSVWSSHAKDELAKQVFMRQALQMTWDYAETNPFGTSGGTWDSQVEWLCRAISAAGPIAGHVEQRDATSATASSLHPVYSTDPPYYDNIGYADLSDYFYVWLRRSLQAVYPQLFSTVLTPKESELIATPHRHDEDWGKAQAFFEDGFRKAFTLMRREQDANYPLTIFYAFKQSESDEDAEGDTVGGSSVASTGWETMLEGVVSSGLAVTATLPIRTELTANLKKSVSALASSIVLACRPRPPDAPITSRREFVAFLKRELPAALRDLQSSNIAPVDLAQAAIGPGMAVYSRYSKVLESSGERLTVRTALALINQVLDEVLAEQEGDYDADTRWSLKWFEQFAHDDGPFGDANTLATAMSIGINGLVETGIVQAKAGKVRLLKRTELMNGHPETWDPATDTDIVHWEVCQYLIHALDTKGEAGAAALLRRITARYPGAAETARELAYRLYTICERKKWAQEAMAYNSLIVAWPEIVKLAQSSDGSGGAAQTTMF